MRNTTTKGVDIRIREPNTTEKFELKVKIKAENRKANKTYKPRETHEEGNKTGKGN